ncbi:hypothetical protein Efla_001272 [Eimeria flavescens]
MRDPVNSHRARSVFLFALFVSAAVGIEGLLVRVDALIFRVTPRARHLPVCFGACMEQQGLQVRAYVAETLATVGRRWEGLMRKVVQGGRFKPQWPNRSRHPTSSFLSLSRRDPPGHQQRFLHQATTRCIHPSAPTGPHNEETAATATTTAAAAAAGPGDGAHANSMAATGTSFPAADASASTTHNETAAAAAATETTRHSPVIEADLPWDRILRRRYPSFKDEPANLRQRWLASDPGEDVASGSTLLNIFGQNSTEVENSVEAERKFVEARWLKRLAEVHRLTDKHYEAVRSSVTDSASLNDTPVFGSASSRLSCLWVLSVSNQEVEAPAPLFFDFHTYAPHFEAYIEATSARVWFSELALNAASGNQEEAAFQEAVPGESAKASGSNVSKTRRTRKGPKKSGEGSNSGVPACLLGSSRYTYGPSVSGFRLKQVTAPLAHRQGFASFFYFHSPHSAPFVPFINACRRETFSLPRPAITALKIENLDSYVDAPTNKPPPQSSVLQLDQQQLQQAPGQRQRGLQKGISPSAFLSRLPVEVGMSVVGMRDDVEDLVENLRKIVFRRRQAKRATRSADTKEDLPRFPPKGSFANPWLASLSVKGPIVAVANDLVLPDELEIVNKSQYLCFMNSNYYLNLMVKIEQIEEYVLPEFGYESLNRDIDAEGYFYFPSCCCPVSVFGFEAQRVPEAFLETTNLARHIRLMRSFNSASLSELQEHRFGRSGEEVPVSSAYTRCLPQKAQAVSERTSRAVDKHGTFFAALPSDREAKHGQRHQFVSPLAPSPHESLGEVVTIELHTDGSATPREAFLEALGRVEQLAASVSRALVKNCKTSRDGSTEEEFEDRDMYTGVPWNPFKNSLARTFDRHKTFFREDMVRQYNPFEELLLARRGRLGVEEAHSPDTADLSKHYRQEQQLTVDALENRLLDEEELEENLIQHSPTVRLERERIYQATLKLQEDIEAGKLLQERGDGQGLPKFPVKHKGLEMPPDWVFEDFMAQRVPIGMGWGFTDD